MLSTMSRQKRAEELVKGAKTEVSQADNAFEAAKERLQRQVEKIDKVRNRLIGKTFKEFHRLFEAIRNEPAVELAPPSEATIAQQLEPLYRKSKIPPVIIDDVKGGKGGAFFLALLAVLITVAAAFGIGAVALGLPLKPETFMQLPHIEKILAWLGGGAYDPALANPLYGAAGLGVAVIAVWLIVYSVSMGKRVDNNLKKAQKAFDEAKIYAEQKKRYAESMETLAEALEKLAQDYETFDVFMEEFNATLRRIRHTEGDDFQHYRPLSQEKVRRAAECAAAMMPLLSIAVVTTEGDPSWQLLNTLPQTEMLSNALIEEKPCENLTASVPQTDEKEREEEPSTHTQEKDRKEEETPQAEEA